MGQEDSTIITIFVVAALLVGGMTLLIAAFVAVYQKRLVLKEQHYQKQLLTATIDSQEREKKKWAREIHDGIGSLLSGINLNLKFQIQQNPVENEHTKFLTEACDMLQQGMADIRQFSHNLLPITLEHFGFLKALEEYLQSLQEQQQLKVELKTVGTLKGLNQQQALNLYRIFQELIQNTIKHARAQNIEICITAALTKVECSYCDDGRVQVDPNAPSGLGIQNIQSRIAILNGTIKLTMENERCFRAFFTIPINNTTT